MKSLRLLLFVPVLFAACATVHDWQEVETAPMTQAECYDGLEFVAKSGGLGPDIQNCDRGLGTWQSRWRIRQLPIFGLGRYRLRAEMLLDEGSAADGWIIRYVVEQQMVEDPRQRRDPTEEDWEDAGQDHEAEATIRARLERKLGPRTDAGL